jgi:hypothetical protein
MLQSLNSEFAFLELKLFSSSSLSVLSIRLLQQGTWGQNIQTIHFSELKRENYAVKPS